MTTQYDALAEQYKNIPSLATRQMFEYNFQKHVGDVAGKAVLDLACGTGDFTRSYKQRGATRVVGVDVSAEMIKLAQQDEAKAPWGIEYIVKDAQDLEKIGDFDMVAASFLLHYAQTREELLKICQTASANLVSGGRFVTLNNNVHLDLEFYNDREYEKYGAFPRALSEPVQEGTVIRWTMVMGDQQFQVDNYHLSPETYEWALRTAGFKTIQWHDDLTLPPELAQADNDEYWQYIIDHPCITVIECQK
jgi:SAM-dependent methyltransferase